LSQSDINASDDLSRAQTELRKLLEEKLGSKDRKTRRKVPWEK
jgi:hypothetical protein